MDLAFTQFFGGDLQESLVCLLHISWPTLKISCVQRVVEIGIAQNFLGHLQALQHVSWRLDVIAVQYVQHIYVIHVLGRLGGDLDIDIVIFGFFLIVVVFLP